MKKLILSTLALATFAAASAEGVNYEVRYASNPTDYKSYDTERLRSEYLIQNLFVENETNMVYTMHDRLVIGASIPVAAPIKLETIDPLKSKYFLERREIGIVNIGGEGVVKVGKREYKVGFKEAIYIGKGNEEVVMSSVDSSKPARFYFNSAPAHKECPTKVITRKDVKLIPLGSLEESNDRVINQYIVNQTTETCQLQMGMTELKTGSVWNTMPTHFHDRRMEAYLYFELPEGNAVSHFMGLPNETRNLWMHNYEAVISPEWSIHAAAGTASYSFIWGMAGENLDYGDIEKVNILDLK
ncbi:MAG: 5-dehydro-4-deoxy-D-glucuronate isomerase [Rikenellaceae bacterium]